MALAALGGCRSGGSYALTVYLLEGAVPPTLLKDFQRGQSQAVQLKTRPGLSQLFTALRELSGYTEEASEDETAPQDQGNQRPDLGGAPGSTTLVSLGDYWLTAAIRQNLIRPLPLTQLSGWSSVPRPWQQLVTRSAAGEPDSGGELWGAPYRTGTLVMVYRRAELDAHGGPPADWQDLWRPELAGKISMLDSARVVVGAVLKALGRDPNEPDLASVAALPEKLLALHRSVKLYSSTDYLQPLILGDVWVAVGWSTDILPLVRRNQRLAVAVPASGTFTTTDLWVQPVAASGAQAALPAPAEQWISFFWQQDIALRLSLLGAGVSPVLIDQARASLPPALSAQSAILPDPQVMAQSSAILPLSPEASEAYDRLWSETRRSVRADRFDTTA